MNEAHAQICRCGRFVPRGATCDHAPLKVAPRLKSAPEPKPAPKPRSRKRCRDCSQFISRRAERCAPCAGKAPTPAPPPLPARLLRVEIVGTSAYFETTRGAYVAFKPPRPADSASHNCPQEQNP